MTVINQLDIPNETRTTEYETVSYGVYVKPKNGNKPIISSAYSEDHANSSAESYRKNGDEAFVVKRVTVNTVVAGGWEPVES